MVEDHIHDIRVIQQVPMFYVNVVCDSLHGFMVCGYDQNNFGKWPFHHILILISPAVSDKKIFKLILKNPMEKLAVAAVLNGQ